MEYPRIAVLLGCLALVPATALAADEPARAAPGERWAALDTDGDGAVSLAEAEAGAPGFARNFGRFDADSDGRVTREEMHNAREAGRAQAQARAEERWQAADTNGDGSIDLAEAQTGMPRAAQNFGRIDADNNGLLSRDEMRGAMRERHAQRQGQRGPGAGQGAGQGQRPGK